ncbi:hypothetical protein D3C72_1961370 [compost metagenome]
MMMTEYGRQQSPTESRCGDIFSLSALSYSRPKAEDTMKMIEPYTPSTNIKMGT